MRVKKIRAKNFSEALTLVKRELGEDAVILSSDDRKGSKPYVEVTAAVDYDIETGSEAAFPAVTAVSSPDETNEIMELKNELKGLRQSIESMKEKGFELKLPEGMDSNEYFTGEAIGTANFSRRLSQVANVEITHFVESFNTFFYAPGVFSSFSKVHCFEPIIKLLSFLNPAGAIIQAILAIYKQIRRTGNTIVRDDWQSRSERLRYHIGKTLRR